MPKILTINTTLAYTTFNIPSLAKYRPYVPVFYRKTKGTIVPRNKSIQQMSGTSWLYLLNKILQYLHKVH